MVVAVCSNSLYADRYCGAEGSSGDPFQMAERILWCLKGRSQKWQPMALVAHAEWCREGPDVQCDFLYIARHNTRHPFPVCLASSPVVLYSLLFRCDLSNHCLHSVEMTLSCLPFAADRTQWWPSSSSHYHPRWAHKGHGTISVLLVSAFRQLSRLSLNWGRCCFYVSVVLFSVYTSKDGFRSLTVYENWTISKRGYFWLQRNKVNSVAILFKMMSTFCSQTTSASSYRSGSV